MTMSQDVELLRMVVGWVDTMSCDRDAAKRMRSGSFAMAKGCSPGSGC